MAELNLQFTKAKTKVEASEEDKSNAAEAHKNVRACLEADETLISYGIDTVLVGSYKRHVAIRRVKDVDVLSKLPQLPDNIKPKTLLSHFANVLKEAYSSERVEVQSRSVKVEFPSFGLAVDVVPARPCHSSSYIEIPDAAESWQQTNPERLTKLTTAMNNSYDDDYVPLVKLIRQTRRHNLERRPGGFYFEILTYHAANNGLDRKSTASLFTSALRHIADQLNLAISGYPVPDPTMPGASISIRATEYQMRTAAERFADLASKAKTALESDDCPAAKAYKEILGCNDDNEWVFEMPAKCNEDGTSRSLTAVSTGERTIPAGNRRFA